MDCDELEKKLSAFISSEIGREEKLRLLFELSTINSSVPDNALDRIKERIALESPKQTWKRRLQKASEAIKSLHEHRLCFPRFRLSWKTTLSFILIIALAIILPVTLPLLFSSDSKALAKEIALKDPRVQAILEGRQVTDSDISEIENEDEHIFVVLDLESKLLLIAEVNTGKQEVVNISSFEVDPETSRQINAIIASDSRIKALLAQGAEVTSLKPLYYLDLETGFVNFKVDVRISLNEKDYSAIVDTEQGKVVTFIPHVD
ncbi:MAG: hypothetical protein JW954_05565 [Dehalococcoidaceae bacterium]|nr:hypothetical protein [Dehalococcoidaceae bacterium]